MTKRPTDRGWRRGFDASRFSVVALIAAACGGSGSPVPTAPSASLLSIAVVSPGTPYVGLVLGLRAVGTREGGGVVNVTLNASWSSSDTSIATVSQEGRVSVLAAGNVEIRATFEGVTGATALTAIPIPLVSGRVTDRIEGGAISGSTIYFDGPITASGAVVDGQYEVPLVPGQYEVLIDGPLHVEHRDQTVDLSASRQADFSVLKWGSSRFGATYDDSFHRFFHQVARVSPLPQSALRRWVIPPSEIYIVEGTVPAEHVDSLVDIVNDLAAADLPALWCGFASSFRIVRGPDVGEADGRILVRPSVQGGDSGTVGPNSTRFGIVTTSFVNPVTGALRTPSVHRAILLHEFFHLAFGWHLCGGDLGSNPFGFGQTNCPFPDSVMANRGALVQALSAQDRLAACLVYHPDMTPLNLFPDTNR